MRTYLIHTQTIGGHQLEYLHHLYMGALGKTDDSFVFVVPQRFKEDSCRLDWPVADHIVVDVMKDGEEPPLDCSLLKKGWINSRTIRNYCKKYHATDVITISIMEYLPYLPFLVRNVRFSGIVYRIYLYEWIEESWSMRIQDVLKYWLISKFRVFHRTFICNDSASAQCLNRLYKTNKFQMMPDPVASLQSYVGQDLRKELGISKEKICFLHPGSMNSYKNTVGILKALMLLDDKSCKDIVVIFAGQISKDVKDEFDTLYSKVSSRVQVLLFDGYLTFEKMADLFATCDYVLVPYKVKSQSSGIVGHAAYYGKPVIAVRGGVIGKMVRRWHLGFLLDDPSAVCICQCIKSISNTSVCSTKENGYLESHSKEMFCNTIYGQ